MLTSGFPISLTSRIPVRHSRNMEGAIRMIEFIPQGSRSPEKINFEDVGLLSPLSIETFEPVRDLPHHSNQNSRPGFTYVRTIDDFVQHESGLESHYVMEADFDPCVTAISCQPFRIYFASGTGLNDHVPDMFVRFEDGRGEVWDVKPTKDHEKSHVKKQFDETEKICVALGWGYRRLGDPSEARLLNLRMLAHFRRDFPGLDESAVLVLDVVQQKGRVPFGELVDACGVVAHVARPTVLTLVWERFLSVDLDAPLSDDSMVEVGDRS